MCVFYFSYFHVYKQLVLQEISEVSSRLGLQWTISCVRSRTIKMTKYKKQQTGPTPRNFGRILWSWRRFTRSVLLGGPRLGQTVAFLQARLLTAKQYGDALGSESLNQHDSGKWVKVWKKLKKLLVQRDIYRNPCNW